MAKLVPEVPKNCPESERIIFERLGRQLPDDWIVLHSLELTSHPHKMWGETDIVVISTKGVFVIEVKGGSVSCVDGIWTIRTLNGREVYSTQESPWGQAGTAAAGIRKKLYGDERFRGCLVGFGVVIPFETFTASSEEIIQEVLWDRRHHQENLGMYIGRIARFWQGRHDTTRDYPPRTLHKPDIAEIRKLLRPDVESHFSMGSYLNALDAELIELTAAQERIYKRMFSNRKTMVTGLAGTGKTVLAFDKAKDCAKNSDTTVLYICFNRLLANHIRLNVPAELSEQITVANLHSYYHSVIERAGKLDLLGEIRNNEKEFYGTLMPEAFFESALTVDLAPFDVLIVDEAQDILTPAHLDALDLLVKGGLSHGVWHMFLDPKQDIYHELSEAALDRLQDIGFASYELTVNCRNTRPIAVETSIVAGFDCAMEDAIDGPESKPITYSDERDFESKLKSEIERLLSQDVRPVDIIILSSRKKDGSLVRNIASIAGYPVVDLTVDVPEGYYIAFSTIHSFKGLERRCVLAIDIDNLENERKGLLHYAGLSRAQFLLTTFLHKDTRPSYDRRLRDFGARLVS